MCWCWSATVLRAVEPGVEYKVKAAFLLNFAKFITWPTENASTTTFPLCIVGTDLFGEALTGIETQAIGGKKIQLRFPATTAKDLGQCRMLFVSQSEQQNVSRILSLIDGKPVAAVSDVEGFADAGGIFEFRDIRGRLSFIINNSSAKKQGLGISSSLLNLAVDVL
jgi:hypothetical protein